MIVGRNAGVKGWLCDNIPEILDKYTTAMRYKAAAKKLRQVTELADPTPADVVLPRVVTASVAGFAQADEADGQERRVKRDYGADEETVVEEACQGGCAREWEGMVLEAQKGGIGELHAKSMCAAMIE